MDTFEVPTVIQKCIHMCQADHKSNMIIQYLLLEPSSLLSWSEIKSDELVGILLDLLQDF